MRRRLFRVLRGLGIVLLLGLGYALWGSVTGLWLPCPFHALTGLECPGCGVTRMCLALLRLDFAAAWAANPGLLLLSPLILGLVGWQAMDYVRTGDRRPGRGQRLLGWTLVILVVGYGILRNCI
ncbi:hypothetical protein B5G43_04480 [Flavonifractor sp. An92]|uniref:DUF2752 domain-containing protein n=1 Tax=Flavonifractor sp. An92 TaxID=1965666 RepID=UPI000B391D3E|nr:DUF2752 domain-containing protein [Flavonifractor sp. An92]OUN07593.1 hypothetical protein B5G43_04480 [Flavonifractor sp. An92]